jgi:hypothetical protein
MKTRSYVLSLFKSVSYSASSCSTDDVYDKYRLTTLLQEYARGELRVEDGTLPIDEYNKIVRSAEAIRKKYACLDIKDPFIGDKNSRDISNIDSEIDEGLEVLMRRYKPHIILGTFASILPKSDLLAPYISNIWIDEASTVSFLDLIALPMLFPELKSIGLIGDECQLPPASWDLKNKVSQLLTDSALSRSLKNSSIIKIDLPTVFRQHSDITKVVSDFTYSGKLICKTDDED